MNLQNNLWNNLKMSSEFHGLTTPWVKDSLLSFFWLRSFMRYMIWSLNTLVELSARYMSDGDTFLSYYPWIILYTSIMSAFDDGTQV